MKDILLTRSGDLNLSSGDIQETDSVRQVILIRLRWFLNEWRLGPVFGVPYFEEILIKNPNRTAIKQIFRNKIMEVDEVNDVRDIEITINNKTREAHVSFTAITDEETIHEEVKINA